MYDRKIAAIHNAILASSTTLYEYLQSVLEVYHVTYWVDDVVCELEKKYEICCPSIVKNCVRKLAHHTFNSTFRVRFKRGMSRHVRVVWYDCLERNKRGAILRKSLFTSTIKYGLTIYIFWVPCVH